MQIIARALFLGLASLAVAGVFVAMPDGVRELLTEFLVPLLLVLLAVGSELFPAPPPMPSPSPISFNISSGAWIFVFVIGAAVFAAAGSLFLAVVEKLLRPSEPPDYRRGLYASAVVVAAFAFYLSSTRLAPERSGVSEPDRSSTAQVADGSFQLVSQTRTTPLELHADTAVASFVRDLTPRIDGVVILFPDFKTSHDILLDILNRGGVELRDSTYVTLTLFTNRKNEVWQVNLTYFIRGDTITRTIAWTPDQLRTHFPLIAFDGTRVQLAGKGSFSDVLTDKRVGLTWDVKVDLPISRTVGKR